MIESVDDFLNEMMIDYNGGENISSFLQKLIVVVNFKINILRVFNVSIFLNSHKWNGEDGR